MPNLRRGRLDEAPYPQAFIPWEPRHRFQAQIVVRAEGDPTALAPALRRVLREAGPGVPVSEIGTAASRLGESLAQRRTQTGLLASFAALALVIAATGLYALLHDAVLGRRREIGIRLSLGAAPRAVRWMVMREALVLTAAGLALGLSLSPAATRLTANLLYGVTSTDPATLAVVTAILVVTAVAAAGLPVRRATAVPPLEALGGE